MVLVLHRVLSRAALSVAGPVFALAGSACTLVPDRGADAPVAVSVDTLARYQVMTGWEAVAQAGQEEPGFPGWQAEALDLAVSSLGINRLRLEVRSGAENPVDHYGELRAGRGQPGDWRSQRYATVNDNADPASIAPEGFHFTELDEAVETVVLPVKQRLEARGERLYLNLNYVAFVESPAGYVHADPEEYAEFLLAAFLHLRDRYQLVPNAVEVVLEPDNTPVWRGKTIGQAIVAAGNRLATAGFRPDFIGPSTTSMAAAAPYLEGMLSVPGVEEYLKEVSYHRYRAASPGRLSRIAALAELHGLRTAMLEHIGSGVEDLYEDLTVGRVSAWQQFALAYPGVEDKGASYVRIEGGRALLSNRGRYLSQYFRYVRLGSVRVGAASDSPRARVVAFQHHQQGALTVVAQVDAARRLEIHGLRPGRYGVTVTTNQVAGRSLGERTIEGDAPLVVLAPAGSVLTVFSVGVHGAVPGASAPLTGGDK